jgi:RNA 3'-terminal phosphate cyclase (ATP)
MLHIDGSHGEGGGQIIRTALTLSAVTKKEFSVERIRPARDNPGLQPQHLMACLAVRQICKGVLTNAELHSSLFIFQPGEIEAGNYEFNIGTAGSTLLVAQTVIPILLMAAKPSFVRIIGGTFLPKSPGFDYFEKVFLAAIAKFGASVRASLLQPGYYPRGGGIIELSIHPAKLRGNVSWKTEDSSHAMIRLSHIPEHVAEREKRVLMDHQVHNIEVDQDASSLSPGNSLTIWQGFRGADVLGERGKRAEDVALEAVQLFQGETNEIDVHLADQLLLYAALAEGKTCYLTSKISSHLETNAYVISRFLDRKIAFSKHSISVE